MNKNIKQIPLIVLMIVLVVTIIAPVQNYADDDKGGIKGEGPYGEMCWCPWFSPTNCECGSTDPNG